MTVYAMLKIEKDNLIQAAENERNKKKIDSLLKKADKVQTKIDNMTIAEAIREVDCVRL